MGTRTFQYTPAQYKKKSGPPKEAAVALTEPYHSRVVYSPTHTTPVANPALHGYEDAGLYYSLGSGEEVAAAFPTGVSGDVASEFTLSGSPSLMVRPTGVTLVAHMEHWRQTRGRELAAEGKPVLDLVEGGSSRSSGGKKGAGAGAGGGAAAIPPYTPPTLTVPPTRAAALGLAPPVALKAGSRPPFHSNHPHTLPFQPVRVLTGQKGVGKSALLTYATHYAQLNSWLTILIPNGFGVCHQGKVMAPSRLRPGSYDQNDAATDILKAVLRMNGPRLAAIPQRGRYASYRYLPGPLDAVVSKEREALNASERTAVATLKAKLDSEGKAWDPSLFKSVYEDESDTASRDRSTFTLHDLVAWGLRHPPAATDTVLALLEEARLVTEFPVLVALDGANHVYEQGPHAMGGQDIPPTRLSLQAALHCLGPQGFRADTHGMARGLWLLALSHKHTEAMGPMFDAAAVHHVYRIPVPTLSRQEVYSQLAHYHKSGNLFMLESECLVWLIVVSGWTVACKDVHTFCTWWRAYFFFLLPPSPTLWVVRQ